MKNKTQPMYASIVISNGALTKFFINDVATKEGQLILDNDNKIVTVALYTQDDVMNFLDKVVLVYQAEEIEI